MRRQQGFTLIEILIALFIFAVMATVTTMGLNSILSTHARSQSQSEQLTNLQIAYALLSRDLSQAVDAPLIQADHTLQPAFSLTPLSLHFTAMTQFGLQEINYRINNGKLLRLTAGPKRPWVKQLLLTGLGAASFSKVDAMSAQVDLPAAVTFKAQFAANETLTWLLPLVATDFPRRLK